MNRIQQWLKGLARGWVIAGASGLGVILVIASVSMYRVYDYVQHDNDFCTSCHLMADPFARFEKSAHRGLGCKACHRPNIWQRSRMGLRQIIEMPDSISQHAEVPPELCAECHVNGNPDDWKLIANSVGHRLHLESNNPSAKNIQCLDCHGAGIHQFAASEKSCGQVGCHEATTIRLGKMSGLAIHCTSCHEFNKPVAAAVRGDSLNARLTPSGNDCLSCHQMREQLSENFPANEPHKAVCGSCHNPHEQKTPAQAVRSCTQGGCHARVDTVTAMHRRLGPGVLQDCTACHTAHTWKAEGEVCTSCHSPDALDSGSAKNIKRAHPAAARMTLLDVALMPTRLSIALLAQVASVGEPFKHKVHKSVACSACHESNDGHGVLKMRTTTDCAGCHHSQASQQRCAACHPARELRGTFARPVEMKLAAASAPKTRTLTFAHTTHARVGCKSCHTKPARMRSVPSCTSCHDAHHTELRTCTSCHTNVKQVSEHDNEVHTTCLGAGCHKMTVAAPFATQRTVCLACHTDQKNHEPGADCASCHLITKTQRSTQ